MKKKSSHIFIFMLLCSTIIFAQSTTSFDQNSVDRPGGSSTFIGVNSGNQTLTGWGNTFLGYNTGNNITNSGLNTFIGAYAGNSVTTGGVNTYIGTFAGSSNRTGSDNIYIGGFNGGNGSKSVIIGNGSGAYIRNNIEYNVFLGHNSGRNALSGGENVYIGSEAAYNNNGYQNIFIGNRAGYSEKTANNKLYVENSDSDTPLIYGDFFTNQLVFNGKVSTGLGNNSFPTVTDGGTDISTYTLFVKGGLLTEELRVLTGWADYVFEDTYKLKPLDEVEEFINKNGHLPNIPSSKEVEASGVEMGEITKLQQEKIEELTLYTIQQQKEIDELKQLVNKILILQK